MTRSSAKRSGRSATASIWYCAAARRPRSILRERSSAMADKLIPTPSQTVGPFFHLGMARPEWSDLTADHPAGEKIQIEGRVIDADGMPVPDAVIELWQANAAG